MSGPVIVALAFVKLIVIAVIAIGAGWAIGARIEGRVNW